ncbi:hypothetical protein OBBRIDRAFT_529325 [Obba rivulosa]|uniref:Uncharacterized protein n=1 Tax=Obba rivulosa TaxID=1052685 RepID=A0A8E2AY78_9APHY|nr:hypothetical protein OBBRIDRAFT_529325 [Obba rivulosa]
MFIVLQLLPVIVAVVSFPALYLALVLGLAAAVTCNNVVRPHVLHFNAMISDDKCKQLPS